MSHEAQMVPQYTHTAMRVRDLDVVMSFYREAVGLKVTSVRGDANRPDAAFMGPGLQLIRDDALDPTQKGTFDHAGLSIANLDQVVANLKAAGVELEEPGVRQASPQTRICFFRDPEGNRVELVENRG